jgi:squalene-associated FAD-dependent desaturase
MNMVARVVIIGGGFSGLSAGVRLAEKDIEVILLERRPHLGGRAYSFTDPATGDSVDNGQHLFMGCYDQTIHFLETIGCLDRLSFQKVPRVDLVDRNGVHSTFQCPALPAPFHALAGLFRMEGITLADKLRSLKVGFAINRNGNGHEDRLTVDQWLDHLSQSDRIRQRFWYPMMIATLNENPDVASARMMKAVLREAFGAGFPGTRIGISRVGLSDLYTVGAQRFIESHGGQVRTGAEVKQIIGRGDSVSGVELRTGESVEADFIISAVPPAAFCLIQPEALREEMGGVERLRSSPIVSINLWFDRPIMEQDFIGLLGTRSQWAFNKNAILGSARDTQHIAVVISAAHGFVNWPKDTLVEMAVSELRETLPASKEARLVHNTIVKEREATLSHTVESDHLRPGTRTTIPNLALAGDWIATGLPATIESAVISGQSAADQAALHLRRGKAAK